MKPRFSATLSLIILNVAAFGWLFSRDLSDPERLFIVYGGVNRGLVLEQGEYWRLLSATFLHGGLLHLAMNMYSLWVVGSFLERWIQWRWFIVFYLVCGLGGSVGSVWWHSAPNVSVGASGAIFGIVGILTGMLALGKIFDPIGRKALLKNLLLVIGLNVLIGLSIPGIDNAGHMGGLAAGLLMGATLGLGLRPGFSKTDRRRLAVMGIALTLGVLALFLFVIPLHS